ncbi:ABC transporter permease [Cryobacterium glaciale]|uniref:ABC transporter permease n=1 Tax=Cryobacterium glaciale TaxID=1259145 RepID=A0A4R8UVS2_9MICO|nr:ABC transporter permease [Cryobacterium glaciale]
MPLFGKAFSDSWRGLLGWGVGLAAAAFLYLPIYPSMSGASGMQELLDNLPPELIKTLNYDQIGTGAGYTQATLFGLLGFLLLSIAATGWGAGALGGDEESGQLELTLAHGVTRVQVAMARFFAIAVKILALSALLFLVVLVLNDSAQLEIEVGDLLGTSLIFAGVSLLTASVALLGGALTGRRIGGIAGGTTVAVLGYVFNALGNQSASLEWLHTLSPYYWAFGDSPLSTGANVTTTIVFYAASLVLAAAAAIALRQRDIGV